MSTEIAWPSRFPLPDIENFQTRPGNGLLRTSMESGPARVRLQFRHTPTVVSVQWRVDRLTFALMESWFKHYLNDGTVWFLMKMWRAHSVIDHRVRFISPYSAQPLSSVLVVVKGELEVDNPPIYAKSTLDSYLQQKGA